MPEAADERGTGDRVPRHVAIIMDGNGRWANARGLPRIAGHREGARRVRAVVEECARAGVEALTLYSFSSENWKRPEEEVAALMELARHHLHGVP
ncbi:MAG: polyprenyl diphosphate synthase, partial [Phycisphaerales bacterium]